MKIKFAERGEVFEQTVTERTPEQVIKLAERVARVSGEVVEIVYDEN